ncbi:MAG: cupin domain-containing protein [Lautropia sp.]|nr:cupin domain-containing protein [Lautropia sp.]
MSSLSLSAVLALSTTVWAAGGEADRGKAHEGFTLEPDEIVWKTDAVKPQMQLLHVSDDCHVVTKRVRIPAGLDLPPHGHEQGYRLVTVVSGTLQLGFGKTFDEKALKTLKPGSVFSEPPGHLHFARTGHEPVVLQLTEVGGKKPDTPPCR